MPEVPDEDPRLHGVHGNIGGKFRRSRPPLIEGPYPNQVVTFIQFNIPIEPPRRPGIHPVPDLPVHEYDYRPQGLGGSSYTLSPDPGYPGKGLIEGDPGWSGRLQLPATQLLVASASP